MRVGWALGAALTLALVAAASCSSEAPPDELQDAVVLADRAPPPISGGTLAVDRASGLAVAADSDRDRIYVVDVQGRSVLADISLGRGEEPGRVALDGTGRAYVALRGVGAIVTIDLAAGSVVQRRAVCGLPRGLAFDPAFGEAGTPALHVACLGGELLTLDLTSDPPLRMIRLDPDLRDVVVDGDRLLVTRMRKAEVLVVGPSGAVEDRVRLPGIRGQFEFESAVAWRAVPLPGGGAALTHQRGKLSEIKVAPGAYTVGDCSDEVVHSTLTLLRRSPDAEPGTGAALQSMPYLPSTVLPVDVAVSADGQAFAAISAGTNHIVRLKPKAFNLASKCSTAVYDDQTIVLQSVFGQPVGVAFDGQDRIIVQSREPAALTILPALKASGIDQATAPISLSGESVLDSGHELFHRPPSGSGLVTCASCHAEGRDDGRTWNFVPFGPRRTQNLRGHLLDTAPFHWDGTLADMKELLHDTFELRMGGKIQGPNQIAAIARWIDSLPALQAPLPDDAAQVERGRALFFDAEVGCHGCHSGPKFTNSTMQDVGTGERLQVPSLVGLWARGPFMHTGCAETLKDRFDPSCGGGDQHGKTSHLSPEEIDDLSAYLSSL